MKRLLVLLALLVPLTAAAITLRADDDRGNYVRLFDIPCAHDSVLKSIPPQHRSEMRMGEAKQDGKLFGMCWLALPDGTVGIVYDDGDRGRIPMQMFKPEIST